MTGKTEFGPVASINELIIGLEDATGLRNNGIGIGAR